MVSLLHCDPRNVDGSRVYPLSQAVPALSASGRPFVPLPETRTSPAGRWRTTPPPAVHDSFTAGRQYSIDLARNIFYAGKPEYASAVLNPAWLDLGVTVALFVVFTVIGTWMFVRADRNR
jgi:hypothetical protein